MVMAAAGAARIFGGLTGASAVMNIVARDRATGVFRSVGREAFTLGGSLLLVQGAVSGLGALWDGLGNTGKILAVALAGVSTGLALKEWVEYNRVVRLARTTLIGYGFTVDQANQQIGDLTELVGRDTAAAFLSSTDSLQMMAKATDRDMVNSLAVLADELQTVYGIDGPILLESFLSANVGMFDQINSLFGQNIKDTQDWQKFLSEGLKATGLEETLSTTERLGEELGRFTNILSPVVARFTELGEAIPLATILAVNNTLEAFATNIGGPTIKAIGNYVDNFTGGLDVINDKIEEVAGFRFSLIGGRPEKILPGGAGGLLLGAAKVKLDPFGLTEAFLGGLFGSQGRDVIPPRFIRIEITDPDTGETKKTTVLDTVTGESIDVIGEGG